jgi:hypothetical protein
MRTNTLGGQIRTKTVLPAGDVTLGLVTQRLDRYEGQALIDVSLDWSGDFMPDAIGRPADGRR